MEQPGDMSLFPPEKRLLFVVTEDWFFVSHFIGFARAAMREGYRIGLVARQGMHRPMLEQEGFALYPLSGDRGSIAIGSAAREVAAIRGAIKDFKPDIVHLVALRPIALGALAALGKPNVLLMLAPTGLGYLWASSSLKARIMRAVIGSAIRLLIASRPVGMLFENLDDAAEFGLAPDDPRVTLLGGAGVDGTAFPAHPDPGGSPVRFGVVARMLKSKGGPAAIAAVSAARAAGADAALDLYGATDPDNPDSMTEDDLRDAAREPGITWHGKVSDVSAMWRDVHVALLLTTYREGLPRAVIEAAASGRPIIATNAPGCREIVIDGETGFLVPPHDPAAAAVAIQKLTSDPALRSRMGEAGRAHFTTRFTADAVEAAVLGAYRALLGRV